MIERHRWLGNESNEIISMRRINENTVYLTFLTNKLLLISCTPKMKFTAFAFLLSASSAAAFAPGKAFTKSSALNSAVDTPIETKTKAPVFDEVCETTGVTFTRFMAEVAMLNPELSELTTLFGAIDTSCKTIGNMVKRSQLPSSETLGLEGEVNIQGEDQKKLDVITNDILKRALRFTGKLGILASEEEDEPVSFFRLSRFFR